MWVQKDGEQVLPTASHWVVTSLSSEAKVTLPTRSDPVREPHVPSRHLDFPVFDADNHFYEPKEALTKFLPDAHKHVIDYVDVRGRTKIVVRGVISDYIPNPTFDVVARPGAQEDYFRHGNPDKKTYREMMGEPMKAIPAFREPAPRLEVMDELGIDHSLMFPTLASLVEERMKDDPELIHIVVHALNEWMYETWSFNYQDRIFATPVITLPIVDKALEELEWCLERGARTVLVRPAPVPGFRGSRSFGLPEFDPFWEACVKANIPVSMHASDSGYAELLNIWEPAKEFLPFRPTAFRMAAMGKRPIEDAMAALVCHGALSRNPDLRVISVENGADWVPGLLKTLKGVYSKMPDAFLEDPVAAFKRGVYVSPFWEDNFKEIVELMGSDRIVFGSDWPHPEGLKDPISFVDDLAGLPDADIARIMGGNMSQLMKIKAKVAI
jgi:predicted TIM-barrel fold metal-dependent hydrolase